MFTWSSQHTTRLTRPHATLKTVIVYFWCLCQYLVTLRSGCGLLPLLRSQREEAQSRGGSVEDEEEVELRLG